MLLAPKVEDFDTYTDHFVCRTSVTFVGFRIRIFFADPDPDPGKNFHADPGGIRGRGVVEREKMIFFLVFFTFQMILNNGCLKSEQKK